MKNMINTFAATLFQLAFVLIASIQLARAGEATWVNYDARPGAGHGQHVVLLAGDEEYRSEEGLPMLAKILSQRHGFNCTVLFSVDAEGTINPNDGASLSNPAALDSADAIVMLLRFRHWDDATLKKFDAAVKRGVPIIALRTSTHAFNGFPKDSPWANWNYGKNGGWGRQMLGETWISHWGNHKVEATRGEIEPSAHNSALLRGVTEVFGNSDVYEAYPSTDAKILLRGIVLKGMNPTDAPAEYAKKRATDKQEQPVNQPAMPVAWSREVKNDAGTVNRILCTTMGAATDLQNEGLRRLVVNGVFWGLGLEVPAKANVDFVDPYQPRMYGFDGFRRGLKASDHALGLMLREGDPKPEAKPAAKKEASVTPTLQLNPGDHIAFIGNALADRMQHHGWLETLIVARFPKHDLMFRNLGFSGDEVGGFLNQPVEHLRNRSENFGSNDDWLKRVKADVVFAFFGYNESFAGPAGLPKFREQLDTFLKETAAKNYSGKGVPRLILFSPLAVEKINDPNQPGNTVQRNADLKEYTDAMRDVAKANRVAFVDLFEPSQKLYAEAAKAGRTLTFNTVHLTEAGDKALAPEMFRALFNESAPAGDHKKDMFKTLFKETAPTGDYERLRAAVNDKNAEFHHRYRTVDGYNVYGGRSQLEFTAALPEGKTPAESERGRPKRSPADTTKEKISNYEILQEEMAQRDVKTANRDQRVWAVAKGGELAVDDSNLPLVRRVPPNRADIPPYLDGKEAITKMTVPKGCKVNLFADEKMFPELINPVQMAWDTKGRLWVAVWPGYPELTPTATVKDKLLILEDTNGDGVADKCTTFLDGLNCPTGFQFYKDGVLVVQAPDLWLVRDMNGDDKPDSMERVLDGISSADSHHTANSLVLDPGGATYLSDGVFHRAQSETPWGVVRNSDAAIYRYEPLTHKYERYAAYNFANPHGRVFDHWGTDIITDATGNVSYFAPAFSGFLDYPAKHPDMESFWNQPSRPCPGTGLVSSRHFPDDWQGNFLNCNVIGMRGIFRVKVNEVGSGLRGETLDHFVESSDENFRPSGVSCAPDGSIYFLDWSQQLIGHMQHHIRDPNRDYTHGRIYRVTYEGRPLVTPAKVQGESVAHLLELLKAPEDGTRTRAKMELGKHDSAEVVAATRKWVAALDPQNPDYQHQLTEALWVHQWHNVVNEELLRRLLRSPEYHARAAATRVLCYWRDRVKDPLALLAVQAADEHPRVRLEAVRAASFFREVAATDVALTAMKFPRDYYLDYTLTETLKQLEQFWRKALEAGQSVAANNPEGLNRLLGVLSLGDLQNLPRSETVEAALLTRRDTSENVRVLALHDLATARKTTGAAVLLDTLAGLDTTNASPLVRMLPQQPPAALRAERERLSKLTQSDSRELRQAAWAALTLAEGSTATTWDNAAKSSSSLTDWLEGLPSVLDQNLRKTAGDKVKSLLGNIALELLARLQLKPDDQRTTALRVAAIHAAVSLPTEQTATFKALASLISQGELIPPAAAGIRLLPRASWSKPDVAPAAAALAAWAKAVPAAARTSDEFLQTLQTTEELTAMLPVAQADLLRAELRSVRVAVFVIHTVREQMRYDTPRIVVEAGKPFEIRIENTDFMPHNFVVVKPGARETIGTITEKMKPDVLDNKGRAFVPEHPDILAATKLLESGQKATIKITAPGTEGICEYVCTFPGHWQVMYGQLVVTKDVDAYLAKHPEAPVAVTDTQHKHHHSEFE